jgi:alanyl-tRNA synthetase
MTERIYYTDPYAREFDGRVVSVTSLEGRAGVVLDRTAFYPTSGGQPFDVGALGAARVLDVIEDDDSQLVHIVDKPLAEGQAVHGTVDWIRRFDHMQQHTGQHVLSAAFDSLHRARTESFHLGSAASTIDLARPVSPGEIASAEDDANRVVWEDRPVTIRFEEASAAAGLPLRKESVRTGTLRLIDIDGYDISACGGTHVARTGAIGVIAVSSWEKFRGGTRVEFVCGGRALRSFRAQRDSLSASVKFLSVLPSELPSAIERLQSDVKSAGRAVRDLQTRLAGLEAQRLIAGPPGDGVIVEVLEGWDQNGLKAIASNVTKQPGWRIALVSAPAPSAIVIARSADGSTDAAAVLRSLIAEFGGKGGGRPELAQGGGLIGDAAAIVAAAKQLLTSNS